MTLFMFHYLFLLLICSLGLIVFSGCSPDNSSRPLKAKPLPQNEIIKAYFNHNRAESANYTDPYSQQDRFGDNLEKIIIDEIASANESIDIAVQEFRLPKIAKALVEKQKEGVKVRVIIDNNYRRPWSNYSRYEINELPEPEQVRYRRGFNFIDINQDGKLTEKEIQQRDALVILENGNVPVLDDTADGSKGSGLMHHKFMVVDEENMVVTSANLTPSDVHGDITNLDSRGNTNNLVTIDHEKLAQIFTEEFELMWGDGVAAEPDSLFGLNKPQRDFSSLQIGNSTVRVNFSPSSPTQPWQQTSNGFIAEQLKQANRSIDIALFVFSYQELSNTLEKLHENGVQLRTLIDPSFAYRYYSEGLDMLGVALAKDCKIPDDNNRWDDPISTVGVPELQQGDNLHHKFAVVDEKIVITGSHNWSAAANYRNDETVLVIDNPTVAAHYNREFEQLYDRAVLGIPQWLAERIEQQQQQCPN